MPRVVVIALLIGPLASCVPRESIDEAQQGLVCSGDVCAYAYCGDGICQAVGGETYVNCPSDCPPPPPPVPSVACPPGTESQCVAVTGSPYVSHFNGADCTGTESYYTPYFSRTTSPNPDGVIHTWDGKGIAGTLLRTLTNISAKTSDGVCKNYWPSGNTLTNFVYIYRAPAGPICGNGVCEPGETCQTCLADCGGCPAPQCLPLPSCAAPGYTSSGATCAGTPAGGGSFLRCTGPCVPIAPGSRQGTEDLIYIHCNSTTCINTINHSSITCWL